MGSKTKIRVEFNNFDAWAARLPGQCQEILKDVTEQVAADAKTDAPVKTGKLRDSIITEVQAKQGLVKVMKFYGLFIEYGTKKMAAKPFLRPAAEKAAPEFTRLMKEMISEFRK